MKYGELMNRKRERNFNFLLFQFQKPEISILSIGFFLAFIIFGIEGYLGSFNLYNNANI